MILADLYSPHNIPTVTSSSFEDLINVKSHSLLGYVDCCAISRRLS
ncbi:MAG: hypothetical protein QOH50_5257 [Kribbellaceae bacterium]|nr:hypothetical protein [Kribbellaceae bacterium]